MRVCKGGERSDQAWRKVLKQALFVHHGPKGKLRLHKCEQAYSESAAY
jgi:hypothetical protein